ncbi:hypothetical protein ACFL1B_03500 [Nanoarchaeota archaeon]
MEKKILIEEEELRYEGLMDLRNLYLEIDQYLREHGYDRYEHKNYEYLLPDGKQVFIELRPWKKLSDYCKGEMKIEMTFKNLIEVEIDHDGMKETLLKGHARMVFQARLLTDYEEKWEATPVYHFIRTFVDKFIHKTQTQEFEAETMNDAFKLIDEIKAFLNLHRYKT